MAAPKYPAHEGLQLDDGDRSWQAPEPVSYLHDNEAFASEEEKFVTSGPPAYPSTAATPVICGLKKRTFWIIFTAVVLIIVIGAVVGGGVGGSLAAKKSKSTDFTNDSDAGISSSASLSTSASSSASVTSSTISTSTTSQSTTTSSATVSAVPLPTSGLLPLDCPAIDSKSYNTTSSGQTYTFSISCSLNFIGHDIEVVGAATIDACMDACANFIPSGGCKAIVFNSNLTLTEPFGGNCWFKNSTEEKQIVTELTDAAATLISITGG